ncbi:MAG: UDP-N-acetylglucosamine pyrophosphorylase related protein, partial [uncultured Nocardioidaceae bacterium]
AVRGRHPGGGSGDPAGQAASQAADPAALRPVDHPAPDRGAARALRPEPADHCRRRLQDGPGGRGEPRCRLRLQRALRLHQHLEESAAGAAAHRDQPRAVDERRRRLRPPAARPRGGSAAGGDDLRLRQHRSRGRGRGQVRGRSRRRHHRAVQDGAGPVGRGRRHQLRRQRHQGRAGAVADRVRGPGLLRARHRAGRHAGGCARRPARHLRVPVRRGGRAGRPGRGQQLCGTGM